MIAYANMQELVKIPSNTSFVQVPALWQKTSFKIGAEYYLT